MSSSIMSSWSLELFFTSEDIFFKTSLMRPLVMLIIAETIAYSFGNLASLHHFKTYSFICWFWHAFFKENLLPSNVEWAVAQKNGEFFLWLYLFLTFWYLKANVQHAFFCSKIHVKSVNGETEDFSSHVWVSTCFFFFFFIALALLALLSTFSSLLGDHLFLCTLVFFLSKLYF